MKEKLIEIKSECVSAKTNLDIETMYIVADFSLMRSIDDYVNLIQDKLSKIDVAVLILNAGVGSMGPFELLSNKDVEVSVNVKALHVIYMAKIMVN